MNEKTSVKFSTKSWHYKLIKFILGSAAPTPYNMFNLCPYFWLLIFSILVSPIVAPIKGFINLVKLLLDGISRFAEGFVYAPIADSWEENLTDLDAYELLLWEKEMNKYFCKIHGKDNINRTEFVYDWWEKKYGKYPKNEDGDYIEEYDNWIKEMRNQLYAASVVKSERQAAISQQKAEKKKKAESVNRAIDIIFSRIGREISSWKNIIKWTKRAVGLVITTIGLVATFFIVNFASRGILWLIDNWDWYVLLLVIISFASVAAVIGIIKLGEIILAYIRSRGRSSWPVNAAYYIFLGIFMPVKWIFYNFLWQIIIVNLWYIIKRGAIGFWDGLLGSLGIFGEYFGASYTDYCPGIDWEEDSNES
jgi:hypothetical protein